MYIYLYMTVQKHVELIQKICMYLSKTKLAIKARIPARSLKKKIPFLTISISNNQVKLKLSLIR